jgi:hypothetical protein
MARKRVRVGKKAKKIGGFQFDKREAGRHYKAGSKPRSAESAVVAVKKADKRGKKRPKVRKRTRTRHR